MLFVLLDRSPINFPVIQLSEDLCTRFALLLRDKCNETISIIWEVATGKDLKKFLSVSHVSILFSETTSTNKL